MRCPCPDGPDGESLVVIGAAVSIQMAQGRSVETVDLLAAFFTVLGDNLALIATQRAAQEARALMCRERENSVKSAVSRCGEEKTSLQCGSKTMESEDRI